MSFPVRDYELAAGLLAQAVAADTSGQTSAALDTAARKLGVDLGKSHHADGAKHNGLRPTLESALFERGYEPLHDDAGTLRMHNCPFRHLAELQPKVVCHMNLALIQGLVEGLGGDSLSPVIDPKAEHCCVAIPAAS